MKFTSLEFLLFLPLTWLIFILIKEKSRWIWLLIASCVFYMRFVPIYLLVMIFLALLDWIGALVLERTHALYKKITLATLVTIQVLQLAAFKYVAFFAENFNVIARYLNLPTEMKIYHWLLPLGISFHTFQSIGYLVDVFKKKEKAEKNPFKILFFIIFFPQLVAGPIERAGHLLKQIREVPKVTEEIFFSGIALIFYGFFKKLVIADNASIFVDAIYQHPDNFHGLGLWLATYLFWVQIYFDFSGYIAIAQGCALLFGYDLMENFRQPYFSRSIADFWQRWHISLSTWFRDYIYDPLMMSGKHINIFKLYFVTIVVFFLSGLWHGPSWNYIFFGLFHGFCIVMSFVFKPYWNKFYKWIKLDKKAWAYKGFQIFVTFHLVFFSWILFRGHSLAHSAQIFMGLFSWNGISMQQFPADAPLNLGILFASIIIIAIWRYYYHRLGKMFLSDQVSFYLWSLFLVYYFLLAGRFHSQDFIYFQF